jgi:hypothetical protein
MSIEKYRNSFFNIDIVSIFMSMFHNFQLYILVLEI